MNCFIAIKLSPFPYDPLIKQVVGLHIFQCDSTKSVRLMETNSIDASSSQQTVKRRQTESGLFC